MSSIYARGLSMKVSRLLPLVGVLIFIYVLSQIDLQQLVLELSSVDMLVYFVVLVVAFLHIPLKALKWNFLIKSYGIKFPLSKSCRAWLVGFGIGQITPGRIGDFARAYYLKSETRIGKSLTTVIIDRVIDVAILIGLAIISMFLFITYYVPDLSLMPVLVFIAVAFAVFLLLLTKESLVRKVIKPFYRFIPEKFSKPGKSVFSDFYSGLATIKKDKKNLFFSTALGAFIWLFSIFEYWLIAVALGVDISLAFMFIAVPITVLMETLPISFSGVGLRDISLIFFFSFVGVPAASAVSIGLLMLLANYMMAFLGLLFWFRDPIRLEKLVSE